MILERYIHREILSKLAWIIGLLILILASHRFVGYLADAAAGQLPSNLILPILGMKILAMLPKLLPMALFLSVILALSRLSRDRELTVVSGAGVRNRFQLTSVFRLSLVFCLITGGLSFYLAPWAESRFEELQDRAGAESDLAGITPGQFREFSGGDRVVYVREVEDGQGPMREVFVQVRQDGELGVVKADTARYRISPRTGTRYILFEHGRRYVGQPGSRDYEITQYRTYAVLLEQDNQRPPGRRLEEYTTRELWGMERARYKAELQWRLSYVITALLLPMLAVAMNRFAFNEQKYTPIFVAILVYFVYSNLLGISKTLMVHEGFPLYIGLWWVHGLLILIIIALLQAHNVQRWYKAGRKRSGAGCS